MQTYPTKRKRLTALISATKILSSTCQLFIIDKRSKKPHGCAVLVTCNSKYYCLSNSHVFNKSKFPNVYMLTRDNEYVLLEGGLMYSEPSFGNNINNDTFDVGIMELTEQVKDKFFGYTFLELDQIETSVTLLRNNVTMIAAYPATKTKFDSKTKSLKFNPLIVRTIPITKDYSNIGFPKAYHHVVDFPKKSFKETSTEQRMTAAQPHGMSGSGLWILAGKSELDYQPFLIGILSEYHENKSMIFSTKIDLYLSIIKQLFDNSLPYNGIKVDLTVN
ncbi:hypothetical protein I5907_20170 [Panacibacter sp. DH6]|uniref:Uncharacterized protein n=1 Tax=Panacibacter microcysteis TaxID=2793269 RepID=A0A931MDU2_9BACT|nr:hypothetical protein [Panacibacter microcysteis]MBG9378563.1 hypothetical protein [Panacibacter microcysteis]